MSAASVGAQSISGADRASKRFKAGRVCHRPGCVTRLSVYNEGDFCYQHEPLHVPRVRGKKIA